MMTVYEAMEALETARHSIEWHIIEENPASERLGSQLTKRPITFKDAKSYADELPAAVRQSLEYKVISIDLVEGVIFCER